MSELLLAGFLNGRGIPLCPCITVPLRVPANAEIVIEGWVSHEAGHIGFDPNSGEPLGPGAAVEGPFGDHTGFYSLPDRYPILHVTAITTRKDPVFPATIVGYPPQEDYYLGKATERIFFPLLRTLIPDLLDYDLPIFGAFHNCAFLQVRKEYSLQARRVMQSVWGAGQMAWTKNVFVVDEDINVHDHHAVLRAAAERCDPARDTERICGPLDILDHAAPFLGAGGKMGFDCTRKSPDELRLPPAPADPPPRADADADASPDHHIARPESLGGGWVFVRITPGADRDALLARALADPRARFVIVLSEDVDITNPDDALFHWCAHADPLRDASTLGRAIVFDATRKEPGKDIRGLPVRDWPPMMRMDPAALDRARALLAEPPPPPRI